MAPKSLENLVMRSRNSVGEEGLGAVLDGCIGIEIGKDSESNAAV
jgi:hypothetical protein